MKPRVEKLAHVPRTAVLCCPTCYRMISYSRDQLIVECATCGMTVSHRVRSAR